MAWKVYITEEPIVEKATLIIRYILSDDIDQKIENEYRSKNFAVAAFKAHLNNQIAELSVDLTVDDSIKTGDFDPTA